MWSLCLLMESTTPPVLLMMMMMMMASAVLGHTCPRICHCSDRDGLVVQCTSRDLDRVPPDLPRNTAVLLLSSNHIRRLQKGALADLALLRELDLSHNALDSVEAGAFQGVSEDLQTVDLSHNQLSGLPRDTFSTLRAQVRLSGNPWHCECSLQEVLRELRLDPETVNRVTCFSSVRDQYVGQPVIQVLDSGVNFCNFHHKTMDLAMFVAMFCWFSMVTAYIVHYVRHNQEDARRHRDYLKTLPTDYLQTLPSTLHLTKDSDTASSVC